MYILIRTGAQLRKRHRVKVGRQAVAINPVAATLTSTAATAAASARAVVCEEISGGARHGGSQPEEYKTDHTNK